MSKFKNKEAAESLAKALRVAMMFAQELATKEAQSGTPFEIHKSINILYKELRADELFIRTLIDGGSKKALREMSVEIIKPQSWRFYTKEKLDTLQ